MSSERDFECCFRGCFDNSAKPDLRIEVFASEGVSSVYRAHEKCFYARREPSIMPDKPGNHGKIPKDVRCVYCGMKLPLFGKHPYCFDVGDHFPPHRYWAHNQCMKASFKINKMFMLPF